MVWNRLFLDGHHQPGLDELEQAEEGDEGLLERFPGVEIVQEIDDRLLLDLGDDLRPSSSSSE